MSSERAQFEQLLDAYLAGELAGDELCQFEAMLDAEPALRKETELQRTIDAALHDRSSAPGDYASKARAMALAAAGKPRAKPAMRTTGQVWVRRAAIAAMLVLGMFGAWQTWQFVKPQPAPYPDTGPRRAPEVAYREIIDAGFEPAWVCKNDQEFIDNIHQALGHDFLIDQGDPGIRVVGLAYANTISPWTVMILSYVNDQPVVVFADRQMSDREMPKPTSPGLSWFKRELDGVVLYELTPFDEPKILPRVYEPAASSDAPEV